MLPLIKSRNRSTECLPMELTLQVQSLQSLWNVTQFLKNQFLSSFFLFSYIFFLQSTFHSSRIDCILFMKTSGTGGEGGGGVYRERKYIKNTHFELVNSALWNKSTVPENRYVGVTGLDDASVGKSRAPTMSGSSLKSCLIVCSWQFSPSTALTFKVWTLHNSSKLFLHDNVNTIIN